MFENGPTARALLAASIPVKANAINTATRLPFADTWCGDSTANDRSDIAATIIAVIPTLAAVQHDADVVGKSNMSVFRGLRVDRLRFYRLRRKRSR